MQIQLAKTTGIISTSETTVTQVANALFDDRMGPYGVFNHLLTEKDLRFVKKFSATFFGLVRRKDLTITAYLPEIVVKAKTLTRKLRAYGTTLPQFRILTTLNDFIPSFLKNKSKIVHKDRC